MASLYCKIFNADYFKVFGLDQVIETRGIIMRVIFHIDLNAFYVSCELIKHPELKGMPVVIAHDSKRSVVSTASYEARKLGIHSAMPLYMAKSKCQNLVIIEPHFDYYHELSHKFFTIIKKYSPYLEIASIDEGYLDLSERITKTHEQPYGIALAIQKEVYETLGLSCSIGISPNKFLSKMASDMKKPMGITILTQSNIRQLLWPMDVGEMFGIGKKTAAKLKEVGIMTIGDVANRDNYTLLKQVMGNNALIFFHEANGRDDRKVHYEERQAKSISNSETFENDLEGIDEIAEAFKNIADCVSERAKKSAMVTNNIAITLKFDLVHAITRQMPLEHYTNNSEDIYSYALMLLRNVYNGERVRLIGISLNDVKPQNEVKEQISLFDRIEAPQEDNVEQLIKFFNKENLGLMKASDLLQKNS